MRKTLANVLVLGALQAVFAPTVYAQTRTADAINILAIANKPPSVVASILGAPSHVTHEVTESGRLPVYEYKHGAVEVVYTRGKADWITIYPAHVGFTAQSLRKFGLPVVAPNASTPWVMRWTSIAGLHEVSFSSNQGTIQEVSVAVRTEPR